MWVTSTRKEKKFQYGLLQQGKRSLDCSAQMLQEGINGAVFDVGRVSQFQRGLLNGRFSSIVVHRNYKRRGFVQLDEGKSFSAPMWFSTSRLVPDCFAQTLQEKKV